MLKAVRYKTHHAWGDSKIQFRFVDYEAEDNSSDEKFLNEQAECIHNDFSFSDKYRGCDLDIIPLKEVPIEELKSELKFKLITIKYEQELCEQIKEALNDV